MCHTDRPWKGPRDGLIGTNNGRVDDGDVEYISALWSKGTYVPESLLLVKGPFKIRGALRAQKHGPHTVHDVVILTKED